VGIRPIAKTRARLAVEFSEFLDQQGDNSTISLAVPADVILFAIAKDARGTGKTLVHTPECRLSGGHTLKHQTGSCECPVRLKHSSVVQFVNALKHAFDDLGRIGRWIASTGTGNPVTHSSVADYLAAIKTEQSAAGVLTVRAVPLLRSKLRLLIDRMRLEAACAKSLWDRANAMRDTAWFLVAWAGLARSKQLTTLMNSELDKSAGASVWRLGFTKTKTCRSGTEQPIYLRKDVDKLLCAIRALDAWISFARSQLYWDMEFGYVFSPIVKEGSLLIRGRGPPARNTQAVHLASRLHRYNMYEKETLHGLRASGAIDLYFGGATVEQVARAGHWASEDMAMWYMGISKVEQAHSMSLRGTGARGEALYTAFQSSMENGNIWMAASEVDE
jgi:integrase